MLEMALWMVVSVGWFLAQSTTLAQSITTDFIYSRSSEEES